MDPKVDAVQEIVAEERRSGERRRDERRQGDRREGDRRTESKPAAEEGPESKDSPERRLEQVRETVSAWEALRAEQDETDEAERKRRLFRRRD